MNKETLRLLADLEIALQLLSDHLDLLTVEVRQLNSNTSPLPRAGVNPGPGYISQATS